MSDQVWLTIAPNTQIGIERAIAMALDEKGFAKLYRQTVYGSSRREAKKWARVQVEERQKAIDRGFADFKPPDDDFILVP